MKRRKSLLGITIPVALTSLMLTAHGVYLWDRYTGNLPMDKGVAEEVDQRTGVGLDELVEDPRSYE